MLNEMLDDFTSAITSNLSTFSTGAMGLVGVLALIDYGLDVMGHAGENPVSIVKMSVRKILKYTFYVFLIRDFPNLLNILKDFFIGLGEELGGTSVGNKPDVIIDTGVEFLSPIAESIKEISSFKDIGLIAPNLLYIILWVIGFVLVAYIVVQVFMTTVEFFLLGGISIMFLPFGVYSGTESLVQNTIKVITGVGTRLTVTVTLASLGIGKIKSTAISINQAPGDLIPFEDIGKFLIFLAIIAYSIWNAPVLISILLQGGSGAFRAGSMGDTAFGMAGAVAGTMGAVKETAEGITDSIGKIGETASTVISRFSSISESENREFEENNNTSYFTTSGLGEAIGGMPGAAAGEVYAGEEGRIIGEEIGKEAGSKLENNEDSKWNSGSGIVSSEMANFNNGNADKNERSPDNENQQSLSAGNTVSSSESSENDEKDSSKEGTIAKLVSENEHTDSTDDKYFDTKSGKDPWED